jgi:hypothetical protein
LTLLAKLRDRGALVLASDMSARAEMFLRTPFLRFVRRLWRRTNEGSLRFGQRNFGMADPSDYELGLYQNPTRNEKEITRAKRARSHHRPKTNPHRTEDHASGRGRVETQPAMRRDRPISELAQAAI